MPIFPVLRSQYIWIGLGLIAFRHLFTGWMVAQAISSHEPSVLALWSTQVLTWLVQGTTLLLALECLYVFRTEKLREFTRARLSALISLHLLKAAIVVVPIWYFVSNFEFRVPILLVGSGRDSLLRALHQLVMPAMCFWVLAGLAHVFENKTAKNSLKGSVAQIRRKWDWLILAVILMYSNSAVEQTYALLRPASTQYFGLAYPHIVMGTNYVESLVRGLASLMAFVGGIFSLLIVSYLKQLPTLTGLTSRLK